MKLRPLVLLAEPSSALAASIHRALSAEGFLVTSARQGADVLHGTIARASDLVVANETLPDMRGSGLRQALAESEDGRNLPLILYRPVLTGEEPSRFVVEPDVYSSEPVAMSRFCQRIRALSRPSAARVAQPHLQYGSVRVDTVAHRAHVDGLEVALTALEFRLLARLMSAQGRVLSRDRLLCDVWGVRRRDTTRTVDTNIKRLRQKLGCAGADIETLRNVGYRFGPRPSTTAARGDREPKAQSSTSRATP